METIKPSQTRIGHYFLVVSFVGMYVFIFGTNQLLSQFVILPTKHVELAPWWVMALLAAAGIAIALYGYFKARENKYFLQWNQQKIRYLLPGQKGEKELFWKDIQSITVKHFEVEILLHNGQTEILNLGNFLYKDMQRAKEIFNGREE